MPDAEAVITEKGVCIEVDGKGGLGPHYSTVLMEKVVDKAAEQGVSVGVARNLSHFGFGGYYTEMAAQKGLIGIVVCNTEPASNPFGGKGKVLGTNPLSFSCPLPGHDFPITVDMATTAAARGKLLSAKLNGESIPDFIAQDKDGQMTNDPEAGLAGSLLPLGADFGYKGTALAMMIDVLGGALSGAQTGTRVTGTATTTVPCTAGFFFLALSPDFFAHGAFEAQVASLVGEMQASGPQVLIPGQREHAALKEAEANGIMVKPNVHAMMKELHEEVGLTYELA